MVRKDIIDINTTCPWNSSYISTYVLLTTRAYDPLLSPFSLSSFTRDIHTLEAFNVNKEEIKSCSKKYTGYSTEFVKIYYTACTLVLYICYTIF